MTTRDNVPGATETAAAAQAIAALRADFPSHEIWREDDGGQVRYVARGQHPHTVVTADLGELRAALSDASAQPSATRSRTASPAAPLFDPRCRIRPAVSPQLTQNSLPSGSCMTT